VGRSSAGEDRAARPECRHRGLSPRLPGAGQPGQRGQDPRDRQRLGRQGGRTRHPGPSPQQGQPDRFQQTGVCRRGPHRAGRQPALERGRPPAIAKALAPQTPDLDHRLAARLAAFHMPTPFTRHNLSALTTEQVAAHLVSAHQVGLLADGPAMTLKGKAAWAFVEEVGRALGKPIFSRTTTPRSAPAKESAMSQPTRSPDHNYPPHRRARPRPIARWHTRSARSLAVSDREVGRNPAAAQGQQRAVPPAAARKPLTARVIAWRPPLSEIGVDFSDAAKTRRGRTYRPEGQAGPELPGLVRGPVCGGEVGHAREG